ncbi:MAG: cobalamin-binding protein [Gloeomargarita sp. SKYG116]|nr:cobalamin-binding protein [Gloeomargarita sp. SKYG116]MDW8400286.1 cobalamin-binding protein [Gloeomargarita sp. SKYGB_i_bin116]
MRLVSLLPSATEIVHALGLTPYLVGRSHECDYPPAVQALPVCTAPKFNPHGNSQAIHERVTAILQTAVSVYDLRWDILRQLRPTHILTQAQCDVCAVNLSDVACAVATRLDTAPQIISLQPQTLAQVWQDICDVGERLGVNAQPVVAHLLGQVAAIHQSVQGLPRPRVLCVEWLQPLMSAGNWVPELVELAGGEPLLATAGQHSPWLTWEQVQAVDPDVIVLMPCGFDLTRTLQEWHASPYPWSTLRAGQTGRIYAADGNAFFNRPGPRLVESLALLAEILHPGVDWGMAAYYRACADVVPVLS